MATKSITIQGEKFEIDAPYVTGHPLTEIEAKVLNQTRAENVRNNVAALVKEAKEKGTLAEVRAKVAEYDQKYTFTSGAAGGVGRRVMDPVERECRSIARDALKAHLNKTGRKLKDIPEEILEEHIAKLVERDDVVKLAKKRVAEKQRVVDIAIDEPASPAEETVAAAE